MQTKELLANILTRINFSQFHASYPILVEVDGRRRSFLLQYAFPILRVAIEIHDEDNRAKQNLCFDGNAYQKREAAIKSAGWQLLVFNEHDIIDHPEMAEFYIRHALGLGPKPNVLESKVVERLKNSIK